MQLLTPGQRTRPSLGLSSLPGISRWPAARSSQGPRAARMRLDDGRVVPNFLQQALKHQPLTVYGDGSQTRSFCYVDDLVEGVYRLLLSDYAMPVNIGNPAEISILDFAEEILRLVGNPKAFIDYRVLPKDDPKQRRPDISVALRELGWEPQIDRIEGLAMTYNYFKEVVTAI